MWSDYTLEPGEISFCSFYLAGLRGLTKQAVAVFYRYAPIKFNFYQ